MATTEQLSFGFIKIEDSPSPEPYIELISVEPTPANSGPVTIDPRDPESFLKRCSGFNKKTKLRCSSVIGKKSEQSCHPTFLPTCRAHRDQQSFAGWCQYQYSDGERCSKLFRWTPPYFELCTEHQGHPDTPCYFFKLPLELRHEIFRYLLPNKPIGSSTAALHDGKGDVFDHAYIPYPAPAPHPMGVHPLRRNPHTSRTCMMGVPTRCGNPESVFPMPALDLFLVNRQFYLEAKDLLFSTVPFTIDVRKDGTFMCGRRLLEPRRADGSSHFLVDEADEAKQRFLKYFDWSAVKHYAVDVLVENWANGMQMYPNNSSWDEEVELYDIRDYISVVVSGVLAKSRNLCKLQVHLCLADFDWSHEQTLTNTKLIVGPFESLRNVRQPQILGVSVGKPNHNAMLTVQRPIQSLGSRAPICSVPPLPTHTPLLIPGMPDFDAYTTGWARWISSSSSSTITKKAPIRGMFTAFKDFYSELSSVVPEVTFIQGRHAFLHRARVAREQEDVEAFRKLRNELIQYWYAYLEQEERKKTDLNRRMSRMLDSDIYPSHEWEEPSTSTRRSSSTTHANSSKSSVLLDVATMAKEGIPMAANPRKQNFPFTQTIGCSMRVPQTAMLTPPLIVQPKAQVVRSEAAKQIQELQQRQQLRVQKRDWSTMTPQTPLWPNDDIQSPTTDPSVLNIPDQDTHFDSFKADDETLYASPDTADYQIDSVDVGCFAHVNLSADWYGEPGPSTKKRRVDSGFSEMSGVDGENVEEVEVSSDVAYVGKGKGRMGAREVICID